MEVFSCTLSGGDLPLLYQLDKLDLYLEPANSGQRGGKRMIFSSHALACGLTEAIRESTLFEVMMGDGEVGESEDERKSESEASPASNYHSDEPSEDGGKDDHDVSAIAHSPVDFELALSENGDSSKAGRVAEGSVNGKSESSVGDTLGESVASLSLNDDEMNKCESQQRNSETTAEDELEKESEADSESPSRYDSDSESSSSQSHHFGFPRNEAAWATSKRFRSVNFVFRLNKFEPTDGRFRLHRDTPYFDGAKNHVSKYTVLIYLSQGESANGSLTIYDCNDTRQKQGDDGDELRKCVVQNIASAQCIIFDQRYPHEGHPFEDGKKIFLRTELIFECPRFVRHEPQIGSLFSSAVYYTLESALDSQFARHADVLYEKANRAHWGLPVAKENGVGDLQDNSAGPMLFKKWRSLKFATDGSTFWFPTPHSMKGNIQEGASPSVLQQELEAFVKECAVVVVLDFFNGKLSETGKAFRKACQSTSASPPKELTAARLDKWVFDELERSDAYWQIDPSASSRSTSAVSNPAPPIVNARDRRSHGASGRFRESADEGSAKPLIPSSGADKKSLLYEYERNSTWWKYNSLSSDVRTEEDRLQALETMVKSYNREAVEYYLEEFEDSIQKLETPALILLLGSRFTFDPDDLAVCANAVKFRGAFGGDSGVPRFNFAAYEYDYDPLNDIAKKTAGWRIVVKGLPPLPFVFVAGRGGDGMPLGVRFRAEFFKNDWAVDVAEKPLHVPVYS
ncbi:hypothetical protein DFJ73DRAFT_879374 [Zopfochytrium polystomum]|nr:hypothetical protein DFJ73DRAFT_879374 [Zopfochytrium polystomum]